MFPPGPCCCREGAAIPGPPPPPPASSSIVCGAPAGAQGETPTAGGRAGEAGPALAAGRRPAGNGAGRGWLLYACRGSEQGAAGRRHYSPSSICPSHSHFRKRGAPAGGGKGGRVGKGIDVGPPLPRSMPGRERLCRRTPSGQIESGLTLRRRTEGAVRVAVRGGEGALAPPLGPPPDLLRVSSGESRAVALDSNFWKRFGLGLPNNQFSPLSQPPGTVPHSRVSAMCLLVELGFNLAGRPGQPRPVPDS